MGWLAIIMIVALGLGMFAHMRRWITVALGLYAFTAVLSLIIIFTVLS